MTRTADFLIAHPFCCFCGGTIPTSTIDHQPAKIIFPDKHRPKGLEFPACTDCNRQTRADEALLALLCRTTGSLRAYAVRDSNRLKDILGSVNGSFPNLLQNMMRGKVLTNERGILVQRGMIDVNQPQVSLSFCRVAAKLTLAIYYKTKSTPAVKDCWINTMWTHSQNGDVLTNVNNIIQTLPTKANLQMGKWNTEDSFFLKCHYEDGQLFLVAIFHESVALIATLSQPKVPREKKWQYAFSPQPGSGITVLPDA
jgi:hypothetical protein